MAKCNIGSCVVKPIQDTETIVLSPYDKTGTETTQQYNTITVQALPSTGCYLPCNDRGVLMIYRCAIGSVLYGQQNHYPSFNVRQDPTTEEEQLASSIAWPPETP